MCEKGYYKKGNKNNNYKKIEAMYHKGYSVDYICSVVKESRISVIVTMQRIFAMQHM